MPKLCGTDSFYGGGMVIGAVIMGFRIRGA